MNAAKKKIITLVENIPEDPKGDNMLCEIVDFIEYLKQKKNIDSKDFYNLMIVSESSTEFWDNKTDDEVWNNV
ncbi:MAG TPA: DUF2281 domain-containing protein [Clostridiales bacterium]|nr:MAG: hypothetical protein A2Y22_01185 [Clostridiales bacterium GWD2_32_59]HAN10574.1 DUF2281 domain-containing protein [Clostridiales bacterium]